MSAESLSSLSDDELMRLVGELAYAQQMMALEGLSEDNGARARAQALQGEMARRGLGA
jgi:hypothetical protein